MKMKKKQKKLKEVVNQKVKDCMNCGAHCDSHDAHTCGPYTTYWKPKLDK
jgi:hypothetical protein